PGEGNQRGVRPPREGGRLHPPHVGQRRRRWGATVRGEAGRAAGNERCRAPEGLPARRVVRRPGHARRTTEEKPDRVRLPRGRGGKRQGQSRNRGNHQASQSPASSSSRGLEGAEVRG
ncbi:MAG: hypothetical protein ACK55Z_35195, partial [bacterium]